MHVPRPDREKLQKRVFFQLHRFAAEMDFRSSSGAIAVPEGSAGPAIGFGAAERLEEGIEERGFARFVVADKEGAG